MRGRLKDIQVPFRSKTPVISFEVQAAPEALEQFIDKELEITIKPYRKKRSLDANAFLWACLGEMAAALRTDTWSMYLYMLERYGKYTYILINPDAVETMQKMWRETKIVGEQGGMVQMLCYFGSSTYNTKEFSRLLDGVVVEMKQMNIPIPVTADIQAMIADMERRERDKARRQQEKGQGGKK